MYDKDHWSNHKYFFSITISSCYFFITFNLNTKLGSVEIPIYNSNEEDDRVFYDKSNKYE